MTRPIRVLHLEDSPLDAELLRETLARGGVSADIVLVSSREQFEAALAGEAFDLILSDYNVPGYDGRAAVEAAHEQRPETPVIVVSGTVGEEEAVRCLHIGATDYLLKHRLERLVPAVQRAIREAAERSRRQVAERELAQRERRLSSIYDTTADVLFSLDVEGDGQYRFASINKAFVTTTGLRFDQVVGKRVDDIVPEPSLTLVLEKYGEAIRGRRIVRWEETSAYPTGTLVGAVSIAPVFDESGRCTQLVGAVHDLTARTRAERVLNESVERLRLAQEAGRFGVFDYDYLTGRNYWSPELEALYGMGAGQFPGTFESWMERVHPEDRAEVERQLALSHKTGQYAGEFRILWPDGSVHWVYARGQVSRDERGQPRRMLGVNVDITERKQLEAQYLQAQRMESVGQLAGGIAHDFNNLLTVINGIAELALAQVPDAGPLQEDLREIRQAGERAAALTRQLLAFSRKQILQPQVLDLHTVVAGMESLLQRLIGEHIDLVVVPAEGLGSVKADPGQIEQVLANLAVNARDAMPQGGRLSIETQRVDIDELLISPFGSTIPPGPYVQLAVSDTGVGMDAATRARIFEPFFTTKGPGQGTGLGLSTVYGIVKQSDGFIWVYSEVGRGTTFKIYLPRVAARAGGPRPRPTVASLSGTETILLVEDMGGLRTLATRILEAAGYTVLAAADGEEALRVLARDEPVHLLLTDVVMPGMSAQTLVERIHATRPALKVLYMSGYTDDVIVRHGVLEAGTAFLGKPFTGAELTRKVREVLDAER